MKPVWRDGLIVLAACVTGAVGSLLFGASPASLAPGAASELAWEPIGMRVPDLDAADAAWVARAPWGAVPKPVEAPPPPPPPPPVPVGVVGSGRNVEAIFIVHGSGDVRVPVGGELPDGGRLLAVSGLKVSWVDGAGAKQERRLFLDPVQLPAGGTVTAAPATSNGAPWSAAPASSPPPQRERRSRER